MISRYRSISANILYSSAANRRPRKDRTSRGDRGAAHVAADHAVPARGHRDEQQVSLYVSRVLNELSKVVQVGRTLCLCH